MASINQGIFHEILNEYRSLCNNYQNVLSGYFDINDEYCGDIENFFTVFCYSAEDIYTHAINLEFKLENLLRMVDFKTSSDTQYEEALLEVKKMRGDIKYRFDSVLQLITSSGGYLSDVELRTVQKLDIYNNMNYK